MSSRVPAQQEKSTEPRKKIQGHAGSVSGVLRLPDSDERPGQIITCSYDGSIRIWDRESGKQVEDAWKEEGSEKVLAIALSPDGKTVASGCWDGAVTLWDIDTGKVVKKWTGHTSMVWCVCWSPDGGRVGSGSNDGTARVWNVESGQTILGPVETGDVNWLCAVCYSPDGMMIATGANKLKIWDANTGKLLKTLEVVGVCLAWTSDGKTLIAAASGCRIKKSNTATWTETAVLEGHEGVVRTISLSPNERILASSAAAVRFGPVHRVLSKNREPNLGPVLLDSPNLELDLCERFKTLAKKNIDAV